MNRRAPRAERSRKRERRDDSREKYHFTPERRGGALRERRAVAIRRHAEPRGKFVGRSLKNIRAKLDSHNEILFGNVRQCQPFHYTFGCDLVPGE